MGQPIQSTVPPLLQLYVSCLNWLINN